MGDNLGKKTQKKKHMVGHIFHGPHKGQPHYHIIAATTKGKTRKNIAQASKHPLKSTVSMICSFAGTDWLVVSDTGKARSRRKPKRTRAPPEHKADKLDLSPRPLDLGFFYQHASKGVCSCDCVYIYIYIYIYIYMFYTYIWISLQVVEPSTISKWAHNLNSRIDAPPHPLPPQCFPQRQGHNQAKSMRKAPA